MPNTIQVADLRGSKRLNLTIKKNRKANDTLYVEAPRYFLLSKEEALNLANHLVDLAETLKEK